MGKRMRVTISKTRLMKLCRTAVVRLHDGSFDDIALIEGDPSYIALMRQLVTGPMDRTPDHYDSTWDKLQYLKSRASRLANKLAGRPATPETAILATIVSKLVNATQTWLGCEHVVVAVMLSSPDRIRLTDEEVGDIFDYLKLRNLMDKPKTLYQPYATSAAYAGYGKGLCHAYIDAYACGREESELPDQRVLHLDLNTETLSGTLKTLRSAYDGSVDATFLDPELGFRHEDARLATAHEDDTISEAYWIDVSKRVRELFIKPLQRVYMPHVTELLLSGPHATNERFHDAIRAAFQDLDADESVLASLGHGNGSLSGHEEWQSLLKFATARGAAEIAKRRQEGPVQCAQSDECRHRRESVHGTRDSALLVQQPESRPLQGFLSHFL
jgi:hypothetical protein